MRGCLNAPLSVFDYCRSHNRLAWQEAVTEKGRVGRLRLTMRRRGRAQGWTVADPEVRAIERVDRRDRHLCMQTTSNRHRGRHGNTMTASSGSADRK